MEAMTEIAKSYYARANEDEKNSIKELFRDLDVNGDGKISLPEFKKSVSSRSLAEPLFKKLDANGDGSLDFNEFICLHYMKKKKVRIARCNGCWDLLLGPYFSCFLCMETGADPHDLCCTCYRRDDLSHHHSSDYMLDHHSLLMVFRDGAAAAEKSESNNDMEELREIAKSHYGAGSPQVQELARKFYESMDTDGDGRVDLSEFLAFIKQEGYSYMQNPSFFSKLDVDGNGTLDFYEVMTLYYIMKSGRPFCDSCGTFIPGIFFSCVDCFQNAETSFSLCGRCYRSKRCTHNHDGRAQFLDNYTLLEALRNPAVAPAAGVISNPGDQHSQTENVNNSQPTENVENPNPTYNNTYVVQNPNANWSTWKAALMALNVAVNAASILCTIM